MADDLITLPLRLWLRSAKVATRVAVGATGRAVSLAGHAIRIVTPGRSDAAPDHAPPGRAEEGAEDRAGDRETEVQTAAPPVPRDAPTPPPVPRDEPAPEPAPPPAQRHEPTPPPVLREEPAPAPPADEPAHVSEEPTLVREDAEPGAEEGAGADVTVLEPWEGYARMTASDVIARTSEASAAELAAVRLYESSHRGRQTVLDAVDRRLKTANGSDRPA